MCVLVCGCGWVGGWGGRGQKAVLPRSGPIWARPEMRGEDPNSNASMMKGPKRIKIIEQDAICRIEIVASAKTRVSVSPEFLLALSLLLALFFNVLLQFQKTLFLLSFALQYNKSRTGSEKGHTEAVRPPSLWFRVVPGSRTSALAAFRFRSASCCCMRRSRRLAISEANISTRALRPKTNSSRGQIWIKCGNSAAHHQRKGVNT